MIPAIRSVLSRSLRHYERHGLRSLLAAATDDVTSELRELPLRYRLYSLVWNLRHGFGTRVTDEDWDVLVVLDACRYDCFRDEHRFDRPVELRVPVGSNTTEFLYRNFGSDTHYDTVYVTANPKPIKLEQSYLDRLVFHDLIDVTAEDAPIPGYVDPATVADAARDAAEEYPDKRLVVHLDQPHAPYSGPTAEEVRSEFDLDELQFHTLRPLIDAGDLSVDAVRTMYRQTLEAVLDVVEPLVEDLDGRVAVTADHGELLGERLVPGGRCWFGHPKRLRCTPLCTVPKVVFPSSSRPEVTEDPPRERREYDHDELDRRLTLLGYR